MGKTVNTSAPYKKRTWRGVTLDNRTISAIKWAEAHYASRAPIKRGPFRIGQGSYNAGKVDASAGTHDGGGVVDIMFAGVSARQRKGIIKWLRRAGFAAWAREGAIWGANGSNDHCHAVLLGHKTASPSAKAQMASYKAHRDGLAYNGYDNTPRPKRPRRWNHRLNKPIKK
jgi:hypothetical protein